MEYIFVIDKGRRRQPLLGIILILLWINAPERPL